MSHDTRCLGAEEMSDLCDDCLKDYDYHRKAIDIQHDMDEEKEHWQLIAGRNKEMFFQV